ncbi:MAG: exodeoxyribonuclease-3 [Planctomycetota bacterium]|jgi:exodeoxyribonuclease-3
MDIVTWNVNSLRARMPRVLEFLSDRRPDVVCLQETKVVDELFPLEPLEDLGYSVAFHGQKTYNGVAILSRVGLEDVSKGMPDDAEDEQARVIAAMCDDVLLLNLYVVNGREVGDAKYEYKLDWMLRVADLVSEYDMAEKVVVTGDFNVTFDDQDLYDPEKWRDKILCSQAERDALAHIMQPGLTDAYRHFHPEGKDYTWWDFRSRGYARGEGLRIDHFLVSDPALKAATGVRVDYEMREGEKPSDHAPVILSLG